MDFLAPPAVRERIASRAAHGVYGYTDPTAALMGAICESASVAWGWRVEDTWIRWHPGLIPGLYHAARLAGASGAVVAPTPVYPPFLNAARDSSRLLELALRPEDAFALDEAALDDVLRRARALAGPDHPVVLLWCNPHNPSGRVWRRTELEAVARCCAKHDAILCSDEVWSALVLDDAVTPFVSMGELAASDLALRERLVVLTSPSKCYNVAALDVALAIVPNDALRRRYVRAGRDQAEVTPFGLAACEAIWLPSSAPPHDGTATVAARRDFLTPERGACEAWRVKLVAYLRSNRDFALDFVQRECAPLVTVAVAPEASYLLWLDATALDPSPALYLQKRGLALTDGAPFSARGYVRLNYGCTRATLIQGLDCLKKAVQEKNKIAAKP